MPWASRFSLRFLEKSRYHNRAVHFLEVLKETRCPGFDHYAWGYPFNWETRSGTLKEGTPYDHERAVRL